MPARSQAPVVLVTGGAVRIGAGIIRYFHGKGWDVIIHCRNSVEEALALAGELNTLRAGSAHLVQAALEDVAELEQMCVSIGDRPGRLNALINCASDFSTDEVLTRDTRLDKLIGANVMAPHTLSLKLSPLLARSGGGIVNILDNRMVNHNTLPGRDAYYASKAALASITLSLAHRLAPKIRVNAVAPGIVLPLAGTDWTPQQRRGEINKILLRRIPDPSDIAEAVFFMATARHITGQTVCVDGGESLMW